MNSPKDRIPVSTLDFTVADLLHASAIASPKAIAAVSETDRVTYEELDHAADQVARAMAVLQSRQKMPRIALSMFPSISGMAAYYGILRSGAAVIPLMPPQPAAALSRIVSETSPALFLLEPGTYKKISSIVDQRSVFALSPAKDDAAELPSWLPFVESENETDLPVLDPGSLASIPFTSGTTGPSKGVVLKHQQIVSAAFQVSEAHLIRSNSVVLPHMPILNPLHMNACVARGATMVFCASSQWIDAADISYNEQVSHFYTVPPKLMELLNDPECSNVLLPTVKYIACGSRALSVAAHQRLADRFPVKVFQGYGQTETSYHSHCDDPENPMPGSVGRALPQTETRIVSLSSRKKMPCGAMGEIEIRGPQVMSGYLNRPDLQPFTDDKWYKTGDVGYLDSDGRLFVVDRVADIVVTDTGIISPVKIERMVEDLPNIREAGVVVVNGPDGHRELVMFVVAGDMRSADIEVRELNAGLPVEERIARIYEIDELPRLPINKKVDRKALNREFLTRDSNMKVPLGY